MRLCQHLPPTLMKMNGHTWMDTHKHTHTHPRSVHPHYLIQKWTTEKTTPSRSRQSRTTWQEPFVPLSTPLTQRLHGWRGFDPLRVEVPGDADEAESLHLGLTAVHRLRLIRSPSSWQNSDKALFEPTSRGCPWSSASPGCQHLSPWPLHRSPCLTYGPHGSHGQLSGGSVGSHLPAAPISPKTAHQSRQNSSLSS